MQLVLRNEDNVLSGNNQFTGEVELKADFNQIGNDEKTGYNKLTGRTKIDHRPDAGPMNNYALQVRADILNAAGQQWGIDCEAHLDVDGAASIRAVQGVAVVNAGFTATSVSLIGVYGQARADGVVAGNSFVAALYGLIEASAAITAGHVTSCWLDSHQDAAVTGLHSLLHMSNNGAASLDFVISATGQAEAFLRLSTAGGAALNYLSDTAETAGTAKKIKVMVEDVAYYINMYPGA